MIREGVGMHVSSKAVRWLWAIAVVGVLALALGGVLQPQRLWPNLLLLGFLSVGFGLGGLLLIAFRDLTGARWNDTFRCVREAMASTLPWTAPVVPSVPDVSGAAPAPSASIAAPAPPASSSAIEPATSTLKKSSSRRAARAPASRRALAAPARRAHSK